MSEKIRPSMTTLNQKLDTLLINQGVIKIQVEKTNGRVTVLERFMWVCLGGAGIFSLMSLPRLIEILGKE